MNRFNPEANKDLDNVVPLHKETVIALWPYTKNDLEVDKEAHSKERDKIKGLVELFVNCWFLFILALLFNHFEFINLLTSVGGAVVLIVLPLFALLRGFTHIKLNKNGIGFYQYDTSTDTARKSIPWSFVQEFYVNANPKRDVLDGYLCVKEKTGTVHKIKLRQIGEREQWHDLIRAIDEWSGVSSSKLDPNLFDATEIDKNSPSYTMLWLEALSAPPERARLNPLTQGVRICDGKYTLVRQIGAGGQGSAYLARGTDGTQVVLKEYILPIYVDIKARKQAIERFQHEAEILHGLKHESIVRLIHHFIEDHRAYLVLEYVDGGTLQSLVEKKAPLSMTEIVEYALSLCDVLSYLQAKQPPVVHGDFTPDNIMVTKDGRVKLIDFMVACEVDPESKGNSTLAGKPSYMAPEQFRGCRSVQSDIYAFGATLYFLITGKEPEPITQLHPILDREDCTVVLEEIVAGCTEQAMEMRVVSMDDVLKKLHNEG